MITVFEVTRQGLEMIIVYVVLMLLTLFVFVQWLRHVFKLFNNILNRFQEIEK